MDTPEGLGLLVTASTDTLFHFVMRTRPKKIRTQ